MDSEDATIGTRLRTLRRWRGMSQVQLAGLAGLAPSFVSMIENGQRSLDRRSDIAAIAAALRVSETDLVGGPHLSADRLQSDPHAGIPALREALQTNTLTSPAVTVARPLADLAAELASRLVPMQANADYTGLAPLLPPVLDELHWHAARDSDEPSRRLALESLTEACVVAGLTARDLGYLDLAHVAVLRAGEAAAILGDPVQQGKADCLRVWTLPRERSWERRLTAAETAAGTLEPHAATPLGTQVLGILTLQAALAAAVMQRPQAAGHWLAEAGQLAARVPDDITGNWQAFSATNVRLWGIAIAVELGSAGQAIADQAAGIDPAAITRRTRRATYLSDVGRGLAREPRTRPDAIRWLREAETAAPQLIRNSPAARETVAFLLQRARAQAGGRELRGMAARMGIAS
jgi:transcriptional regulator with XRE-family HTH domain